jgi:hypothetical protein
MIRVQRVNEIIMLRVKLQKNPKLQILSPQRSTLKLILFESHEPINQLKTVIATFQRLTKNSISAGTKKLFRHPFSRENTTCIIKHSVKWRIGCHEIWGTLLSAPGDNSAEQASSGRPEGLQVATRRNRETTPGRHECDYTAEARVCDNISAKGRERARRDFYWQR